MCGLLKSLVFQRGGACRLNAICLLCKHLYSQIDIMGSSKIERKIGR